MTLTAVHLGMDDIDSPRGGCTTHFASLLVEVLTELGARWLDYPNLIRLNPNIPYRTRGNGAVTLRFKIEVSAVDKILPRSNLLLKEYLKEDYPNTNPGMVIATGDVPADLLGFAKLALWRTVPVALARRLVAKLALPHIVVGNGRGLIGALSAIGNQLRHDHTYEYIAYRSIELTSRARGVDVDSVFKMNQKFGTRLFSNVDITTRKILIEPHGPDPVIYGIRGETPLDVIKAAKLIQSSQDKERWMVFRTNQGTGEHLRHRVRLSDIRPYMAAVVEGEVTTKSKIIEGGHVIFRITDDFTIAECAVYEPTGDFREIATMLTEGDKISLDVGVRPASRMHGLTLNVEGLEILQLTNKPILANPICPHCLKRMKSAGKEKGFKCIKCGFKDPQAKKIEIPVERQLKVGRYLPPPRAQRHLTRPKDRMDRRNKGIPNSLVDEWYNP